MFRKSTKFNATVVKVRRRGSAEGGNGLYDAISGELGIEALQTETDDGRITQWFVRQRGEGEGIELD